MKMLRNLLLIFFLLSPSVVFCQELLTGEVVRISDGDTITILENGNKQTRIRFYGIDCPESGQDFGTAASYLRPIN